MTATAILDALQSHALRTGHFSGVNGHEPKSPPQSRDQIVLSFWAASIAPIQGSGLNSLSYRLVITGRIYANVETEPADGVDPQLLDATIGLLSSLAADFQLADVLPSNVQRARYIDFLGSEGEGLDAVFGYFEYGEGVTWRCVDITIPILINDLTDLTTEA